MNITEIIFLSAFSAGMGFLCGKICKGLNPFLLFFGGLIIGVPSAQFLISVNSILLTTAFIIGFLYNYGNPFRKLHVAFEELKISWMYRNRTAKNSEDLHREKEELESELYRQKKAAEENIREQERAAEENLRRQAEELHREKEQFQREQERAKNNQKDGGFNTNLNPKNFADACKILGVGQDGSLKEFKQAHMRLVSMFHSDKIEKLKGVFKAQAEESVKLVNVAWETVKQKLR